MACSLCANRLFEQAQYSDATRHHQSVTGTLKFNSFRLEWLPAILSKFIVAKCADKFDLYLHDILTVERSSATSSLTAIQMPKSFSSLSLTPVNNWRVVLLLFAPSNPIHFRCRRVLSQVFEVNYSKKMIE
jgi:hypothetical protein